MPAGDADYRFFHGDHYRSRVAQRKSLRHAFPRSLIDREHFKFCESGRSFPLPRRQRRSGDGNSSLRRAVEIEAASLTGFGQPIPQRLHRYFREAHSGFTRIAGLQPPLSCRLQVRIQEIGIKLHVHNRRLRIGRHFGISNRSIVQTQAVGGRIPLE